MAVPRNRLSNARKKKKRAHQGRTKLNLTSCKNCGNERFPHRICTSCGFYGGRSVIKEETAQA